ncbi:lipid-A-disaccharide synthase [Gloeocapsa sp. PCC 73106]|uniref:lipid-A-disaccharide synthase n=1 Tax=Gloeocapsa sp. PCC 73106 TaxID=102232 RepID=UPI0002AC143F|nr:lipid-A-disaccharide synthase [Gloeocapsa sp. PCC 73106]ELR99229.1 lipid-A-disaccharide synthase [Gloeocapsa sp. PCC 73106]
MRIFISTGEVSGDLQGAMLVASLYRQASQNNIDLEIIALGGEQMAAMGATVLHNTSAIGSVGLLESLPLVLPTWQIQRRAKAYLLQHPPDLVVLIDYSGPNLAIGGYLRQHLPNVPIVYYIAPQTWVWSPTSGGLRQLVKITDYLLAIFPEEARFFQNLGMNVTWVGHPLLDRLADAPQRLTARQALGIPTDKTVITLLPASRQQEIKYILPVICRAAQVIQTSLNQNVEYLIPLSLSKYRPAIAEAIKIYQLQARIIEGNSLDAIAASDLAITKSGTVNLEIALLNVPQVVLYRVHPLTMWIARHLLGFSIPFMSPPNLVMNRTIVPELLQEEANCERIVQEAKDLLENKARIAQIQADYQEMRQLLGEVGVCDRTAQAILNLKK